MGASVFNEWKWVAPFPYYSSYIQYIPTNRYSKVNEAALKHCQSLFHFLTFIRPKKSLLTESLKPNYCFALERLPLFNSSPYLTPYSLILTWHVFTSLAILISNNYIFLKSLLPLPELFNFQISALQ